MENTAAVTQREEPMPATETLELIRYINLKLAALGQPVSRGTTDGRFLELAGPLLRNYYQKELLLGGHLCPADAGSRRFSTPTLGDWWAPAACRGCRRGRSCSTGRGWRA